MAWPMIEWSLDTYYRQYFDTTPPVEQRWILHSVRESDLIPMMEELLATFPNVSLSSLPSTTRNGQIDFGLKGKQNLVEEAAAWLVKWLDKEQIDYTAARLTD